MTMRHFQVVGYRLVKKAVGDGKFYFSTFILDYFYMFNIGSGRMFIVFCWDVCLCVLGCVCVDVYRDMWVGWLCGTYEF